ncbi:MAG: VOC family protein [Thermoplasmata archaeon]
MAHHVKMEHTELVSKDPAATQQFLEKAFGLKFTVLGEEMGNYRMLDLPEGTLSGGIGIRSPMGPEHPGTVGYLTVPDIDEAIKSVKSAGAKIVMEKTEIPKMGFMAVYIAPGDVAQGLCQWIGR